MEVHICVSLSPVINPHQFILRLDLLGIDSFCSQGNFVLFVVVDGGHLFHKAEEERDCVSWEMFACVSVSYKKLGSGEE